MTAVVQLRPNVAPGATGSKAPKPDLCAAAEELHEATFFAGLCKAGVRRSERRMASTRRLAAILVASFIPTVLVLPLLVTHGLILWFLLQRRP